MTRQVCSLLLMLVVVVAVSSLATAAQTSTTAGTEGPPTESESLVPSADAKPRGVRVRWYDVIKDSPVESDRQMIVFGATGQEIESLLGEDHYADWVGEDAWVLGTRKYGGWWADFGDEDARDYQTTLFFIDGRFYRYFVGIMPERFALVDETLTKALGPPTSKESSSVQSVMGGEYDQEIRIWESKEVDVHLLKRASKVTEGLLSVTFKPLAAQVPVETAEAPF